MITSADDSNQVQNCRNSSTCSCSQLNHNNCNLVDKMWDFFSCLKSSKKKHARPKSRNTCRIIIVTVLSLLFIMSLAGTGIMWFTDLYVEEIINQMTLREGSEVYYAWKKPPVKPLICIFVFNYTNVDEYITKKHSKIKLKEVGPYCYRETLEKKNVIFNDDGTITYGDTRKHKFEPEHSNGTQNDTLIVPNMALIVWLLLLLQKTFNTLWRKI